MLILSGSSLEDGCGLGSRLYRSLVHAGNAGDEHYVKTQYEGKPLHAVAKVYRKGYNCVAGRVIVNILYCIGDPYSVADYA